jgi:hypothetical protein
MEKNKPEMWFCSPENMGKIVTLGKESLEKLENQNTMKKFNEEYVQQVRNSELAILNDGSLEKLREVIKYIFPDDETQVEGKLRFYFKGEFNDREWYSYNLTDLPYKSVKDFFIEEKKYPKVMEVSDDNLYFYKRVVFMEKKGYFLVWDTTETIKESEDKLDVFSWKYAREIQPKVKLTLKEIAEKFNTTEDNIEII